MTDPRHNQPDPRAPDMWTAKPHNKGSDNDVVAPKCDCPACAANREHLGEWHDKMMQKYGWYIHLIPNHDTSPTGFSAHTHGFEETFKDKCSNVRDVDIVFPLPSKTIQDVLMTLAKQLENGKIKKIDPTTAYAGICKGYHVMFVSATEGDRAVWRMILPDSKDRLLPDVITAPYVEQWEGVLGSYQRWELQ